MRNKRVGKVYKTCPVCGNAFESYFSNERKYCSKKCAYSSSERGNLIASKKIKHKKCDTRLYNIWAHLSQRTTNPKCREYKWYGKRGIYVCPEWQHRFDSFLDWAIHNGYRDDLTLDRIDNNGNYEPQNCRWVSMKQQNRNKRSNRLITYNGKTHCVSEWAEIIRIPVGTLLNRVFCGWTDEEIITIPLKGRRSIHNKKGEKL